MSRRGVLLRIAGKTVSLKQALELFLIVFGFGLASLIVTVQPLDGDTWWHLRSGEETFAQGSPLAIDEFSYTRYGEPYSSHSWLTDLVLFMIFKTFGFTGLSTWIGGLALLALFLVYMQMEGPRVYRIGLILITAFLLMPFLKTRPQMVTLLLLLVVAWILNASWKSKRNYDLLLIPIFVLWSNLHGGFVIGIFYYILFIVSQFLENLLGRPITDIHNRDKTLRLIMVFVICLLVVMVHPMGLDVWKTLPTTMNSSTGSSMIVEWASPNFHDPGQQIYLWWLMLILVMVGLSSRKPAFIDILSLVSFTIIGFIWRRHISFLVVFGAIFVSKHLLVTLTEFWQRLSGRAISRVNDAILSIRELMTLAAPKIMSWICPLVIAAVVTGSILKLYLITTPEQIENRERQLFPYDARAWIVENHPEGPMLNSYNWGGYFDWTLREYPVFLDSRADLFGDEIIGQWKDVMDAREGWQDIVDHWGINLIVIEPDWHIVDILSYHGWEELYRDDQAVIFGRSNQE